MERVNNTGILSRGIDQKIQNVPIRMRGNAGSHNIARPLQFLKEKTGDQADLDPFPEQKSGQNDLVGLEYNLKELLIMSTKIIF